MQVGSLICGERRFLGGVFQRGVVRCGEEREKRKEVYCYYLVESDEFMVIFNADIRM